ncbi:hypothetical protein TB1_037125 [Malus domestica]
MTQFQPISLCNVLYKIIAKIITNRMKVVLQRIISMNQSAFVVGRQIQDNILVVHEILHCLKMHPAGEDQYLAMKLDMAKAYDRVEWSFLLAMIRKLGFCEECCKRIEACISIVTYSVLINGLPNGYIQQQRGLRQGNLMSSFLFLICAEGLSALLRRNEEIGVLHGMQVAQGVCLFFVKLWYWRSREY